MRLYFQGEPRVYFTQPGIYDGEDINEFRAELEKYDCPLDWLGFEHYTGYLDWAKMMIEAAKGGPTALLCRKTRGDRIVGAVTFMQPMTADVLLANLMVRPCIRRNGYGREMFNMLCNMAKDLGKPKLCFDWKGSAPKEVVEFMRHMGDVEYQSEIIAATESHHWAKTIRLE